MTTFTPTACRFCAQPIPAERAAKYNYCTAPACAKRGFQPRTAVGVCLPKSTPLVVGFLDVDPHLGLADGFNARRTA